MYASQKFFGSSRATIGRTVLFHSTANGLEPCVILNIQPGDIVDVSSQVDGRVLNLTADTFEPRNASNVDDMPCGAWTWPPFVAPAESPSPRA